jgi:hypothetical protein
MSSSAISTISLGQQVVFLGVVHFSGRGQVLHLQESMA